VIRTAFILALTLLQAPGKGAETGTVVGVVKPSGGPFHVVLLPAKYQEMWVSQVQQRLDNYWEKFKPEFAENKMLFKQFNRLAYVEALRYVTEAMRRELGSGASLYMKDTNAAGQFEFRLIPIGTYQMLVTPPGKDPDFVWATTVDVKGSTPVFVDLGKPIS